MPDALANGNIERLPVPLAVVPMMLRGNPVRRRPPERFNFILFFRFKCRPLLPLAGRRPVLTSV
jgi:hypothetical protein